MAAAPETGELRVRTAFPGFPVRVGPPRCGTQGHRDTVIANSSGEAVFTALLPRRLHHPHGIRRRSARTIPKRQFTPKACFEVNLFRALWITGRVITRDGAPASRVKCSFALPSTACRREAWGPMRMGIISSGSSGLANTIGINLNQAATRFFPTPVVPPRTGDPAAATRILFQGKPETRIEPLTLPDTLPERTVNGTVVRPDGSPAALDSVAHCLRRLPQSRGSDVNRPKWPLRGPYLRRNTVSTACCPSGTRI